MKRCVIIGSVDIDFPINNLIKSTDTVFCADKGWKIATEHGIKPDYIIGDFDSSEKPQNIDADIIVLPVVKDDTDTLYIAKQIVDNGYTDVLMLGLIGGKRIEHTLANIQTMLYLAQNRVNVTAMDKYSQLTVIENGEIMLPNMDTKFLSVFSLGEKTEGVTITGAKYSIENHTLTNNFPLGVSNEFIGNPVKISVKKGALLIVISKRD